VGVVGLALIVNPKLQLNSVEEKPSFFLPQQSKQQNNFVAIIPSFSQHNLWGDLQAAS
jgi:hypothetical protein